MHTVNLIANAVKKTGVNFPEVPYKVKKNYCCISCLFVFSTAIFALYLTKKQAFRADDLVSRSTELRRSKPVVTYSYPFHESYEYGYRGGGRYHLLSAISRQPPMLDDMFCRRGRTSSVTSEPSLERIVILQVE